MLFLDRNRAEAKPQYKAAGFGMARETFASAAAIKAEQTDVELCLEFVNIASAATFLKVRAFPPRPNAFQTKHLFTSRLGAVDQQLGPG